MNQGQQETTKGDEDGDYRQRSRKKRRNLFGEAAICSTSVQKRTGRTADRRTEASAPVARLCFAAKKEKKVWGKINRAIRGAVMVGAGIGERIGRNLRDGDTDN